MPCETYTIEGAFAGSSIFFCSQPAEPCAFCGAPSVALCDWPVEREEYRAAGKLVAGDEINFMGRRTVVKVDLFPEVGLVEITWRWNGQKERPYSIDDSRPVAVFVPGAATCDNPVCDLHRRNLDDERDHCRDHWTAWEGVA
jgi:hypothetical protein